MHSTTGYPNTIEGYFVADEPVSNARTAPGELIETWLEGALERTPHIRRAHLCPDCGYCDVDPPAVGEED